MMELEVINGHDQLLEDPSRIVPCALITKSCASISPENLVKEILGRETLPDALKIVDGISSFPWHIDTKYYEADISLSVMEKKTLGNQEFANSVNAVLICFDSNSSDGLTVVEQWFTFTKEFHPDIQILVCDQCKPDASENGVTKVQAQTWCVQHGFELVELNAEESEDSDVEDDFQESLGIKRVVQALQAHLWPNLTLKDRDRVAPHAGLQNVLNGIGLMGLNASHYRESSPNLDNTEENTYGATTNSYAITTPPALENAELKNLESKPNVRKSIAKVKPIVKSPLSDEPYDVNEREVTSSSDVTQPDIRELDIAASSSTSTADESKVVQPAAISQTSGPRNEKIDTMLQAVDSMSVETFEELFQNLNEMKTKAQNLSPSERKSYAEQMAVAFWRSVGGNESEVDGLCSDDDA